MKQEEKKTETNATHKLALKPDGSKIQIYGVQGSGKTYFTRALLKSNVFKRPIIYVVNKDDEYSKIKKAFAYIPENAIKEFDDFIKFALKKAKEKKIDCIVIDEADLFFRYSFEVNRINEFNDLVLNHRHYGVSLIVISRRPQDLPTKIVESCKHTFIFKLEGANALKKFEEIEKGLANKIRALDYKSHKFIYKIIGEPSKVFPAIKVKE